MPDTRQIMHYLANITVSSLSGALQVPNSRSTSNIAPITNFFTLNVVWFGRESRQTPKALYLNTYDEPAASRSTQLLTTTTFMLE
jgi:hypothetical protein